MSSHSSPIPAFRSATSPSRNIESVISFTNFSHPRPRPSYGSPSATHTHRGGINTLRNGSSYPLGMSAGRPTPRSFSAHHSSATTTAVFEPRVVRADTSRSLDHPSAIVSSPTRQRVSSNVSRSPTTQRHTQAFNSTPAIPFVRPPYLEHSSLRHFFQDESFLSVSGREYTAPQEYAQPSNRGHTSVSPSLDSDDESSVSHTGDLTSHPTAASPMHTDPPILTLPTRWSGQMRHPMLYVSGDGLEVSYQGNSTGNDKKDASAVRTHYHIPPACGIYYYEVEITGKGAKGYISVGFVGRETKLSRLPGSEKNSWGYHGDDGCIYAAEKEGTPFGQGFGTGDVIGCGIDFSQHKAFYTKNGQHIGSAFDGIGKDSEIYPCVGLRHVGEAIRANFGHQPFKYDIDYHVQQQHSQAWTKILANPVDLARVEGTRKMTVDTSGSHIAFVREENIVSEDELKAPLNKLILSYLTHHGYAKTARALKSQSEKSDGMAASSSSSTMPSAIPRSSSGDIEMGDASSSSEPSRGTRGRDVDADMERRTHIVQSVARGDIDTAIRDTQLYHPSVLLAEEGLMHFKLKCRKFIELILAAAEMKKRMDSSPSTDGSRREDGVMDGGHSVVTNGFDVSSMDIDDDSLTLPPITGAMNGLSNGKAPSMRSSSIGRASTSTRRRRPVDNAAAVAYEAALTDALNYGQFLQKEYEKDTRDEVKRIFKRTFSVVAYDDPIAAGGEVAAVAGLEARATLANALNQAILKSQGRPIQPPLETLYRRAVASIVQLGLLGEGAAAFADVQKELLDP